VKLHPLSVPYRAVASSLNLGTLVFLATALGSGIDPRSAGFLGLLGLYFLVMIAYQAAYYTRFEYHLSSGTLDIASGVFGRREREIPLRRVQNVDVAQNPFQRALGIAAVQIETAGGGDTEATLNYVAEEEATRLRRELRRLLRETDESADADLDERDTERPDRTDVGFARPGREERLVFELPTRNLVLLSLFTIDPGAGVLSSLFGAVASGGDPTNLAGIGAVVDRLPGGRVEAILVGVAVIGVLAWLLSVVLTFARYYGFELYRTEDGLEYERGFVQRYSGTIPPEKIQALTLQENVLERRFGYATLAVETAGYSANQSGGSQQKAVPLAKRDRTVAIARSIESFESPAVERPPTRARRRYLIRFALAVAVFAAVAYGVARFVGVTAGVDQRYWLALLAPLVLAPAVGHYTWLHRGHRVEDEQFLARNGYWRRVTRVVPYYRIQTVVDSRTVFQRRRNLASVTADTASTASILGGSPTAIDVDSRTADTLRETLNSRLQASLRAERLSRSRDRTGPGVEGATRRPSPGDRAGTADGSDPGGGSDDSDPNGNEDGDDTGHRNDDENGNGPG